MGVVDLTCPSVHADGVQRIDRKLELSQNQSLRNGSKLFTKFVSAIFFSIGIISNLSVCTKYIYIYIQAVRSVYYTKYKQSQSLYPRRNMYLDFL